MDSITGVLIPADVQEMIERESAVVSLANALTVTNQAEATQATEFQTRARKAEQELEAKRVAITKPMDEAKAKVMELFRRPIEALGQAKRIAKAKVDAYLESERKKAEAIAARQREEAERERQRLAAEARRKEEQAAAARAKAEQEARDRQREADEAEARRVAAVAEGNAKAAAQAAAESAKAIEQAKSALSAGHAKADELQSQASAKMEVSSNVAVMTAPTQVGIKGHSGRTIYGCEVFDIKLLVADIVAGQAPYNLIEPNETALRQRAQSEKEEFKLGGCRLTKRRV